MGEVAQASPSGLMSIGTVAARNIALALNLPEKHIGTIERAIKDEIGVMSSHFTLAIADAQTQYELQVAKVKSTFSFVEANKAKIAGVSGSLFAAGALFTLLLKLV